MFSSSLLLHFKFLKHLFIPVNCAITVSWNNMYKSDQSRGFLYCFTTQLYTYQWLVNLELDFSLEFPAVPTSQHSDCLEVQILLKFRTSKTNKFRFIFIVCRYFFLNIMINSLQIRRMSIFKERFFSWKVCEYKIPLHCHFF